jgi:hypothetical protein
MKAILITLLAFAGSFAAQADDYPPYHEIPRSQDPDHEINNYLPYCRGKVLYYQQKLIDELSSLKNPDGEMDTPDDGDLFNKIKKDQISYDNAVEAWWEANGDLNASFVYHLIRVKK